MIAHVSQVQRSLQVNRLHLRRRFVTMYSWFSTCLSSPLRPVIVHLTPKLVYEAYLMLFSHHLYSRTSGVAR